jgi:hypothetical protein
MVRVADRIEQEKRIRKQRSDPDRPTGYKFKGGRVEFDYEDDRLRLHFPGKPDAAARSKLKRDGFKWSPRNSAWQRKLNANAKYAAKRVLGDLDLLIDNPKKGPPKPYITHKARGVAYSDRDKRLTQLIDDAIREAVSGRPFGVTLQILNTDDVERIAAKTWHMYGADSRRQAWGEELRTLAQAQDKQNKAQMAKNLAVDRAWKAAQAKEKAASKAKAAAVQAKIKEWGSVADADLEYTEAPSCKPKAVPSGMVKYYVDIIHNKKKLRHCKVVPAREKLRWAAVSTLVSTETAPSRRYPFAWYATKAKGEQGIRAWKNKRADSGQGSMFNRYTLRSVKRKH